MRLTPAAARASTNCSATVFAIGVLHVVFPGVRGRQRRVCSFHPVSATDLVSKGAPACTAPAVVLTVLAVPGFTETQSKERAEFGPLWHARNQHRSAGHQRTVEIERTAAELDDARAHHAQRRPPLIFVGW